MYSGQEVSFPGFRSGHVYYHLVKDSTRQTPGSLPPSASYPPSIRTSTPSRVLVTNKQLPAALWPMEDVRFKGKHFLDNGKQRITKLERSLPLQVHLLI